MTARHQGNDGHSPERASTTARAFHAAGDADGARDLGALDAAVEAARTQAGHFRSGLVERLIYGPPPPIDELQPATTAGTAADRGGVILDHALQCLAAGRAFTAEGALSLDLRQAVARQGAYGFTVPREHGGLGASYAELADLLESLAAAGLAPLAVELSGALTIGAGALVAYGTDAQKRTYLPLVAEGTLMGFALTEVRVGVNAKKIQAYVVPDTETGGFRLFADGNRNKLYITNATHGALVALVARLGPADPRIGLFIVPLPSDDVSRGADVDYEFRCTPTGVEAFRANHNARLHFDNFPLTKEQAVPADGVEALFYSLGLGRAMLAAMSAGYQHMLVADATAYARIRDGVGGRVIQHELPRLRLARMLGGAFTARALARLTLAEHRAGVDLAGLRDLTKSAAASSALESMIASERVLGGRAFQSGHRVNDARANLHVFGVVEGEDDLIRMGMVRDVTRRFTERYLDGLLSVLESLNRDADGRERVGAERLLRIDLAALTRRPMRCLATVGRLIGSAAFWRLAGWSAGQGARDVARLANRAVPLGWSPRYRTLPPRLGRHARFAERRLRRLRWSYVAMAGFFQLELTRAQLPLQRLGRAIEHLVSILAICHQAARLDVHHQRVADLECELRRVELRGLRLARGLFEMQRLRGHVAAIGAELDRDDSSLLRGVAPDSVAHPWDV